MKKLNIRSFDTVTTKLLLLIVFTTIIPLVAVTNFSIKLFSSQAQYSQTIIIDGNHVTRQLPEKRSSEDYTHLIMTIFLAGFFVAIGFAIFFSRKITTPILNLMKAANIIANGDLEYELPTNGNDEIAQLGRAFNKMTKELRQQNQLRDNFIASLTHDLKVPMLAENQTIKYLLKGSYGPITDDQKEVLEIIRSTNNSSLEMVSTLLDVYKYDMGKEQLFKEKINIVNLLAGCINEIKSLTIEKNILIDMEAPSETIIMNVDKIELHRVFHNIIANAIANTLQNGKIVCRVESFNEHKKYESDTKYESSTLLKEVDLKDKVLISIADNGKGIEKEDIMKLFSRFSLSKGRKPAGTGIGLYFSFQVVSKHNGLIWCESTEGKGSRFNILLPIESQGPVNQQQERQANAE